ncbi:MAG: lytic transglycosylase domain-containing protein, partial [Methyloligellaceae bacterium]
LLLVIVLAQKTRHPNAMVRAAKIGLARGWMFETFAYPLDLLPALKRSNSGKIERALIYATVAQESEFNAQAISRAGARGLMQLMPGTAAQMARLKNLDFSKDRLTTDPAYNLRLGTAYLSSLLETFNGSTLLALAAYNAGPNRVGQWIRQFGDPRRPNVDPVDWIERLPYKETRQYVKKILAGLQIFRSRLGDLPNPDGVLRDLKGKGDWTPTASISNTQ